MRNSLVPVILGAWLAVSVPTQSPAQTSNSNPTNLASAQAEPVEVKHFRFAGGNFHAFLAEINRIFGVNLGQIANTPGQFNARVPSMQIKTANVWDVLDLYNAIAEDYPGLGKWVVKRMPAANPSAMPNAIFLKVPNVPVQTDPSSGPSIHAFSLRGFSQKDQEVLRKSIDEQSDLMVEAYAERRNQEVARDGNTSLRSSAVEGSIRINSEAVILVATGGKQYLEMVTTFVEAFREGHLTPASADATVPKTDK